MDNILVVNQGSARLKLSLFSVNQKILKLISSFDVDGDIDEVLPRFTSKKIVGIGHRLVHGGFEFCMPTKIDSTVIQHLEKYSEMAPLHNPICLKNIQECVLHFGSQMLQIAVFDTAFHQSIPKKASTYAIPYKMTLKHHIMAYGFHGIAHEALWNAYLQETKKKSAKVITVHLGGGCSITAISQGASVDTSMGFTPLQGLMMETRSGDIDPGLLEYLCLKENKSISEITKILNQDSGLLGVSGVTSKMKELLSVNGQEQANLAIEMFCYRIVKYIGAYIAILGGIDALIFSGGIGENACQIRKCVVETMQWYKVLLDVSENEKVVDLLPGEVRKISDQSSLVDVFVIGSNENYWIAGQVFQYRKRAK